MARVDLPEKVVFESRVAEIQQRVDNITSSNRMAKLLHGNFKTWLNSSSISPLQLTLDMDNDRNGYISQQEFATLLESMTGERPPNWVSELVFSFVDAKSDMGIPLSDWLAFLAASGMDIPEDMFPSMKDVNGTIVVNPTSVMVGESVKVVVEFDQNILAYEIAATNLTTGEKEGFLTPVEDMDAPNKDEFVLEPDETGEYEVQLIHLGKLLALTKVMVDAPVIEEPSEEPTVDEKTPAENKTEDDVENEVESDEAPGVENTEDMAAPMVVNVENHTPTSPLIELIQALDKTRLRSESVAMLMDQPSLDVAFVVTGQHRTLLGEAEFKNGTTLTCSHQEGFEFELMTRPTDTPPTVGQRMTGTVVPMQWSIATRRLLCRER